MNKMMLLPGWGGRMLRHILQVALLAVLPVSVAYAGDTSVTLNMLTRVSTASCNLTVNQNTGSGTYAITFPDIYRDMFSNTGRWNGGGNGGVLPLHLGLHCGASAPEIWLKPKMSITGPGLTTYNAVKTTRDNASGGGRGPDIFFVFTTDNGTNVPLLANDLNDIEVSFRSCNSRFTASGSMCIQAERNGKDWELPLGVGIAIPEEDFLSHIYDSVNPGIFHGSALISVSYE